MNPNQNFTAQIFNSVFHTNITEFEWALFVITIFIAFFIWMIFAYMRSEKELQKELDAQNKITPAKSMGREFRRMIKREQKRDEKRFKKNPHLKEKNSQSEADARIERLEGIQMKKRDFL